MLNKAKHNAGWICTTLLLCALVSVLIYFLTSQTTNKHTRNQYTDLVSCAIYYNELEAYGENRPALTEQNFRNLIWKHLEPYRKQHISTNERYVWGDYNQQRAYLLFFLKHYYDNCLSTPKTTSKEVVFGASNAYLFSF